VPDLAHLLLFLALGAVLGMLSGLFGIGGGIIAIPVLTLFFGLDQQHAQGTALVMVAPNVLVGLWNYWKRGDMDGRVALLLASCAVPFTFIGALYATRVAGPGLRYGFAGFIAMLALYFGWRTLRGTSNGSSGRARLAWGWTAIVGAFGGILSGLFSVGGAVFAVPFLTLVFGYTQTASQGLSLALVAPGTIVGIIAYEMAGDVDWWIGIPLAVGGTFFVRYGVALAHRLPEQRLRILFSGMLVVTAIALALKP
jgi:uncharacterized membrane protein YfcA